MSAAIMSIFVGFDGSAEAVEGGLAELGPMLVFTSLSPFPALVLVIAVGHERGAGQQFHEIEQDSHFSVGF